jgi:homocysteine S-methyltransferase
LISPLDRFLQQNGFVLLDGGLATELEARGHDLNHKLWSAKLLRFDPLAIRQVHYDFLVAGADCITTATYQANLAGFAEVGIPPDQGTALTLKAVELAVEARQLFLNDHPDSARPTPLVAASLGPYGAYLADGSEYRGRYRISNRELHKFHQSRWQILQDSGADIFAFETIPSLVEAEICLEILQATPAAQAWISFSCKDGQHICDGTPLKKCAELVGGCDQILAVGVNCTAPHLLAELIPAAKAGAPNKAIVVYPNSGESYDGDLKQWSGVADVIDFEQAAVEWFELGATLIGGCCRTTPAQIAGINKALLASM